MDKLPRELAIQSVVDSTVVVPKLITVLFDRLTPPILFLPAIPFTVTVWTRVGFHWAQSACAPEPTH